MRLIANIVYWLYVTPLVFSLVCYVLYLFAGLMEWLCNIPTVLSIWWMNRKVR